MVAKSIFKYDLWNAEAREDDSTSITVHCFMPNGLYMCFKCLGTTTIFEMKEVRKVKLEQYLFIFFFIWGSFRKKNPLHDDSLLWKKKYYK